MLNSLLSHMFTMYVITVSQLNLLQAEHGPDSQVVLVIAGDGVDWGAIEAEVSKQCNALPRGEFASKALSHSFTVFAKDMVEVIFHPCFLQRMHLCCPFVF